MLELANIINKAQLDIYNILLVIDFIATDLLTLIQKKE